MKLKTLFPSAKWARFLMGMFLTLLILFLLWMMLYFGSHSASSEMPVSIQNRTSEAMKISKISLGRIEKHVSKDIEANASSLVFSDKNPLSIKNDGQSDDFSLVLSDGRSYACKIKNKRALEYCGLKVAILEPFEMKCICDGPGDFSSK